AIGGRSERATNCLLPVEAQERKARPQPLKDVLSRGERLRRKMMSRARPERMGATRAAAPPRRSPHDRRSLAVWLKDMDLGACARLALRPRALEAGSVAERTERCKEAAIIGNRLFDEIARRRLKDGATLGIVRLQQVLAAPTLQHRGKLPSQIARILKPDVDAIPPVRRMAVGGIACNKDAARAIALGNREAQVPKPDVIERNAKLGTGRGVEKVGKVEGVPGRGGWDGSVEKPAAAEIHAAEELPVAVKLRVENAVEGFAGIALQQAVQALRAKHQQHHQPIMVRQVL